jgi:glycosyltransferase involved in cell wall biosynthesis
MKKKHLVLVTTWFPPTNGVAVNRMDAFVKYLDKNKLDVSVITLNKDVDSLSFERMDDANIYRITNKSFFKLAEFNKGHSRITHVAKVLWNYFVRAISKYPLSSWMKQVNQQLIHLHKQNPIDIVLTSSAPIESHLAVFPFLENRPTIKWIADCRDELSLNPHLNQSAKRLNRSVEDYINKRASILTTVSHPIVADFQKLCPALPVHEIKNGHQLTLPAVSDYNFNKIFTIVYAGTFYGVQKPTYFFTALIQFLNIDSSARKVHIQFVGTPQNFDIPKHPNLTVEFIDQCTYQEACRYQQMADANLLILAKMNRPGVYSGKLFDYLACCKPIIAVVDPTDVAADLIKECRAGYIADFDNIKEIETAIFTAYQNWSTKTILNCDRTKIEQLHRKYQVEKLNQLIDSL